MDSGQTLRTSLRHGGGSLGLRLAALTRAKKSLVHEWATWRQTTTLGNGPFEIVKGKVSAPTRNRILKKRMAVRRTLPLRRLLPDFLILGGQRCGTSSLYKYLGAHPQIVPSLRKETRYFSTEYERGIEWYLAHFPTAAAMNTLARVRGSSRTFEATPDYLFDPRTPSRVATALPGRRFIVVLRDPVERAYSHWRHMQRQGYERLPFADAVAQEGDRIGAELERLGKGGHNPSKDVLRFSYIARGRYARQLERWFGAISVDRFMILDAHELYGQPEAALQQICRFVGVEEWVPSEFRNFSHSAARAATHGEPDHIPDALRRELDQFFAVENDRLADITGREFSWM